MSWEALISVLEDIGLDQLAISINCSIIIERTCYPFAHAHCIRRVGLTGGGHYFHQQTRGTLF